MFLFQFAQSGGRNGHFGFVYTISYTATECIFGCTDVIKPFLETQRGREVEIIRIYTEFITKNPTQHPSSNNQAIAIAKRIFDRRFWFWLDKFRMDQREKNQ